MGDQPLQPGDGGFFTVSTPSVGVGRGGGGERGGVGDQHFDSFYNLGG